MNLTEKSSYNWILTILKLCPIFILFIMLQNQSTTITAFAEYFPTFSFTTSIINYLSSVGIVLGDIGVLACCYFNYIVMLHLIECLIEVVVFLPHLFINFIQRMYK